jgi:hypothetical protein
MLVGISSPAQPTCTIIIITIITITITIGLDGVLNLSASLPHCPGLIRDRPGSPAG